MEEDLYFSPSFNSSYSSHLFVKITGEPPDDFEPESSNHKPAESVAAEFDKEEDEEGSDDFEFSLVPEHFNAFSGDFVYGGQIGSAFPVFNQDLLLDEGFLVRNRGQEGKEFRIPNEVDRPVRIPLRNLFLGEREEDAIRAQSSSSSEADDELESVPPGTYCVWRPRKIETFPSVCEKSSSTGSVSKRGKLRKLLRRINSDGNERYVFLTPKGTEKSKQPGVVPEFTGKTEARKIKGGAAAAPMAAHEAFYLRSKAAKEGEKRKSYLPYRRELVGFFANANPAGFGKTSRSN
ncbi:unnamed protein product [Cuscuta europaea]|uniref:Uncharacterized protein n=1 Tax=Cuscuta europaea TaxID=41803 RepID=A0A9P1E6P7_CUSEU|nr:unnamed protein product [Cuscuta europaea]